MKAMKAIVAVSLIILMLMVPVFAAEFVPSNERQDGVQLISYILEEIDTPCRTVHIIPYHYIQNGEIIDQEIAGIGDDVTEQLEEEIRISLKNAYEELKNNLLQHLVVGFDEIWEAITGGAPVENAIIHDLFEIVLICSEVEDFKTDEKITVSFTVDGISADDLFVIIHKPTDSDEWIVEEHTIDENGVITMTVDKLSPFALVKDSGKAPASDVTSPQTGVSENSWLIAAVCAVVLTGGAVLCVKKIKKESL